MRAIIIFTIPGIVATWWFILSVLPHWVETQHYSRCMARDAGRHYVHPEMWEDEQCYAWRSDTWSVSAF